MSSARARATALSLLMAAALLTSSPSGASATAYVVSRGAAYPGASHEVAVPTLVLPRGTTLVFVNLHLWGHNITSDAWRTPSERLFRSEIISFREQAVVEGVEQLEEGTYGFFCRNHMGMRGSITIV